MSDIERKAKELYRARQMGEMSISITFSSEDYADYIRAGAMDFDNFAEKGKEELYDAVCDIVSEHRHLISIISDLLPDNEIERLDKKTQGYVKCFREYEKANVLAEEWEMNDNSNRGKFIETFKHNNMNLYHEDGYLNDGIACLDVMNATDLLEESGYMPTMLYRLNEPVEVKDLLLEILGEGKDNDYPEVWTEVSFHINDQNVYMECEVGVHFDNPDARGKRLREFGYEGNDVNIYTKKYEILPLTLEEREYILAQYAETVIDILPPASRDAIRHGFPDIPQPMQSKTDKGREDL